MMALNLLGLIACVIVLMGRECTASWRNEGQKQNGEYVTRSEILNTPKCQDDREIAYCKAVKERGRCDIPMYKSRCKQTCDACTAQSSYLSQTSIDQNTECRDIGWVEFCKPLCKDPKYENLVSTYCKKTCGLCRQPEKKKETCVDRPICEKLTKYYKITSCTTLRPRKLRKRALRKCPKLCGLCVPPEEKKSEEPSILQPTILEPSNLKTIKNTPGRAPHPEIETRETDHEARRGVFYIYTKYLSL